MDERRKWIDAFWAGLKRLTQKERWVHGALWGLGLLVLNWPGLQITVGPFYSAEFGLLVPSVYGGVINAFMAYGIIGYLLINGKPFRFQLVYQTLLFYVSVSLVESVVDGAYFLGFIKELNQVIIREIWQGNLIMNFFLFYVPALVYGIVKTALIVEVTDQRISVQDGHQVAYLKPDELLYLESDGNYVKFHLDRKVILERNTLISVASRLPPVFIRIHKSFIVNKGLIDQQSASEVLIKGRRVPIGRKFKENLSL